MKKTIAQRTQSSMTLFERTFFSTHGTQAMSLDEKRWVGLCVGLGLLVLTLDLTVLKGMIIGVLYACIVLLASRLSFPHSAYVTAAVCSGLILLSLGISGSTSVDHGDFVNRLLSILAIWVTAFLSLLWDKPYPIHGVKRDQQVQKDSLPTGELGKIAERPLSKGMGVLEKVDDLEELNRELLNKNQDLETLINVVSHDLRSPLVNIQGFSKELSDSCERLRGSMTNGSTMGMKVSEVNHLLDEEIPEALLYIRAGAEKINSVLSGILRFSRLGRLSLKIEELNVNAIVCSIATVMEFQLKEKGVLLQMEDLPNCMGDEILVSQVFSNLIENAHKYLDPSRSGVIRVSGKVEGGKAIYAVKDNGIGIQYDHQGKIFEMFHRLDPKEGSGEGLGLTLVRRIVERHQGELWVNSEYGVGTTFFVSFSLAPTVPKEDELESAAHDSHC